MIGTDEGHPEVVKLLLAKGADLNTRNEDAETAMQIAQKKHQKAIEAVLNAALSQKEIDPGGH